MENEDREDEPSLSLSLSLSKNYVILLRNICWGTLVPNPHHRTLVTTSHSHRILVTACHSHRTLVTTCHSCSALVRDTLRLSWRRSVASSKPSPQMGGLYGVADGFFFTEL